MTKRKLGTYDRKFRDTWWQNNKLGTNDVKTKVRNTWWTNKRLRRYGEKNKKLGTHYDKTKGRCEDNSR